MWNLEYKAPRGCSCAGRSVAVVRFDGEGMWPRQVSQTGDGNLAGFVVKQSSPPPHRHTTHARTHSGRPWGKLHVHVRGTRRSDSQRGIFRSEWGHLRQQLLREESFENILMHEWKEGLVDSMTRADFVKWSAQTRKRRFITENKTLHSVITVD